MLSLLLSLLLSDAPAPVPVAGKACYAVHCDWTAEHGGPVKGTSRCLAGYVSDKVALVSDTGATVYMCVCCPSIEPPKGK